MGIDDIDQVMRNTTARLDGKFSGANIEMTIDLKRIAIDDFSNERFRQFQCKAALAGAGGPDQRNQRQRHRVQFVNMRWRDQHGLPTAPGREPRYTMKKMISTAWVPCAVKSKVRIP